ncbi:helicase-associated domain-containing protein [Gordonia sp. (in: high G+C Gram-positive bacteria)]|uniref:helicase-associated domain-containing protein n=1 Tax=Gordonia sp. (in: high G+C Gram-positive bacteria) TaxID=84139 RepID=UPI0016941F18|nr:helicase-associated domain-containing protein [Gordonia sp. (in: high G+C Gram-positive bacteria)]NLG46865.1 helicase-associated domain-containing protein [Gordonia sp. (in: high G+C Gram-positive bacteria)]
MSPDLPLRGLADDLTGRSDDALAELLIARPDLASPPPRGTAVLAGRALSAASISLAGENLDLLSVAVLEAFLAAAAEIGERKELLGPVGRDEIVGRLGKRALRSEVDARLEALVASALLWGTGPLKRGKHTHWIGGAHLPAALPWRAHHLLGPVAQLGPDQITALIDATAARPRELLATLAQGAPLGRSRDAAPDADPSAPVPSLIALGLLARVDEQTVELPPQVGQVLRDQPPLLTASLGAPSLTASTTPGRFDAATVDAAGAGEALELLRHADDLIDALGTAPAAILRSGGVGIRELRRLAKTTALTVTRVGLLVELLARQRLVDGGVPDLADLDVRADDVFAPTTAVDAWAHLATDRRWFGMAHAWLDLPRRPWQIGDTDRDGNTLAALSSELFDANAGTGRRAVLAPLLDAEPAHPVAIDTLVAALGWRHPRQLRRMTRHVVSETLREATELGLVAHGSLTTAGRAALTAPADDVAPEAVLTAMSSSLPELIDYFLVQADLTVMVPGPLQPDTADQLRLLADLESGGAASMYRVTDDSVRRALDTGRSTAEIGAFLEQHSRTPVPQSLTYLIDDVARRHGSLRVGVASSFVRCDDTATLAEVLRSEAAADLALRALAPTVAVSAAPFRDVVERLREAGFAPAGEDSAGALIDLRSRGVRVAARSSTTTPRRGGIGPGQASAVVSRMRTADRAANPVTTTASGGAGETVSALVQLALQTGRRLRIGYVDAHGAASRHVLHARSLSAGQLVADEEGGDTDLRFPLHRITRAEVL